MSVTRKIVIAVIGGGVCAESDYELARQVGALIAQTGAILVCGGLGGVMEAASRGAAEAGGEVLGILPGHEKSSANRYVTLPLPTGLSEARNVLVVNSADAVIALNGEYGTMSEIALALRSGKRVVSLGGWDISSQIIKAASPEEAVRLALEGTGER